MITELSSAKVAVCIAAIRHAQAEQLNSTPNEHLDAFVEERLNIQVADAAQFSSYEYSMLYECLREVIANDYEDDINMILTEGKVHVSDDRTLEDYCQSMIEELTRIETSRDNNIVASTPAGHVAIVSHGELLLPWSHHTVDIEKAELFQAALEANDLIWSEVESSSLRTDSTVDDIIAAANADRNSDDIYNFAAAA